jgi:hypothetical protein
MQYVIVRSTRRLDGQEPILNAVYGPFDEQGCSAAYRVLRREFPGGDTDLTTRGLLSIAEEFLSPERATKVDRVRAFWEAGT